MCLKSAALEMQGTVTGLHALGDSKGATLAVTHLQPEVTADQAL